MTRKQQRLLYTVLFLVGGFYVWSQYGPQIAAWFSGLGGGGGSTEPPPDDDSGTIFGTLAGILESLGSIDLSGIVGGIKIPQIEIPDFEVPDIKIPDIKIPDIVPAVALTMYGLDRVAKQGEHWRELYGALTEEEQAGYTAISGNDLAPNSVKQQRELFEYVAMLENDEAEALLNPSEKQFLEYVRKRYGK